MNEVRKKLEELNEIEQEMYEDQKIARGCLVTLLIATIIIGVIYYVIL